MKDLLIILFVIVLLLVFLAFGKIPGDAKAAGRAKTLDVRKKPDRS